MIDTHDPSLDEHVPSSHAIGDFALRNIGLVPLPQYAVSNIFSVSPHTVSSATAHSTHTVDPHPVLSAATTLATTAPFAADTTATAAAAPLPTVTLASN